MGQTENLKILQLIDRMKKEIKPLYPEMRISAHTMDDEHQFNISWDIIADNELGNHIQFKFITKTGEVTDISYPKFQFVPFGDYIFYKKEISAFEAPKKKNIYGGFYDMIIRFLKINKRPKKYKRDANSLNFLVPEIEDALISNYPSLALTVGDYELNYGSQRDKQFYINFYWNISRTMINDEQRLTYNKKCIIDFYPFTEKITRIEHSEIPPKFFQNKKFKNYTVQEVIKFIVKLMNDNHKTMHQY